MTAETTTRPEVLSFPGRDKPDPVSDVTRLTAENKRIWNEVYAAYIMRERHWKTVALVSLGIAGFCCFGMFVMGTQSKIVPYVVQVDKLGSALPVQRADIATSPSTPIIRAQLAHWIECVRSLYQDRGAIRTNSLHAYEMIRKSDPAFNELNAYFTENDPFKRAENEGVSVEVSTAMPISGDTWQVQWLEKVHNGKGELVSTTPMQANITIAISTPTTEDTLKKNPEGIYIKNFNWSTRL